MPRDLGPGESRMIIPVTATPYIKLHRTNLRNHEDVPRAYAEQVRRDYELLAPHLPATLSRVLDIGCGIGGIDVLIHQNHGRPQMDLMDGTGVAAAKFGFLERLEPYNDMQVTMDVMRMNRVDGASCLDLMSELDEGAYDLVLSLLSWGHHYPVRIYLSRVTQALKPGGLVVLDLRKHRASAEELTVRGYQVVAELDGGKSIRTILKR